MEMESFIGCLLSIDCGTSLGVYQGRVASVNQAEQSVTLDNPFRNGTPSGVTRVTLSAKDIKDLQVLKLAHEFAQPVPVTAKKPAIHSEQTKIKSTASGNRNIALLGALPNGQCNKDHRRRSQTPDPPNIISAVQQLFVCSSSTDLGSLRHPPGHRRKTASTCEFAGSCSTTEKPTNRKEFHNQFLSGPLDHDALEDDFDFEENLKLFDKKLVLSEISRNGYDNDHQRNFRYDENIVKDESRVYCSPRKPTTTFSHYVTDQGIQVPVITPEQRQHFLKHCSAAGFRLNYVAEIIARTAVEFCLQILGGASRFSQLVNGSVAQSPQIEIVVLLGTCAAQMNIVCRLVRYMTNRSVSVTVLVPHDHLSVDAANKKETSISENLQEQGAKIICSVAHLPTRCDMIVSCLSSFTATQKSRSDLSEMFLWANGHRSSVFAIEPDPVEPTSHSPAFGEKPTFIETKWALFSVCPLRGDYPNTSLYLCDLGVPKKLFTEAGISNYVYPFRHKFTIPLHKPLL